MRKLIFVIAVFTAITASAQENNEPAHDVIKRQPGKNEMGFFTEPISPYQYDHNYNTNFGLMFKRWARPHIAYRIMLATGHYNQTQNNLSYVIGDTVFRNESFLNIPLTFIGGGVEVHRHFYKKVYLYAALELNAGYGRGYNDKVLVRELAGNSYPHIMPESTNLGTTKASAFTADAMPLIGAKINFRRICIGTEATAIKTGVTHVQTDLHSVSTGHFDIGNFRQRFYINYRF